MTTTKLVDSGLIVDTNSKLTAASAAKLYTAGVRWVWRYVFFRHPQGPGDLDAAELAAITGAGLGVLLVQHVRNPGWVGSSATGASDAAAAIANAQAAGCTGRPDLPSGDPGRPVLALDLEGIGHGGPEHSADWCPPVDAAGYRPLVYVGYASGMTTATLDALAGEPVFWCDFAPFASRPQPTRPWGLHQHAQETLAGVGVDRDDLLTPGAFSGYVADDPSPAVHLSSRS
jgi:hypothetical protein